MYAGCAIGARTQCTSHMSKETCISSKSMHIIGLYIITKTYAYLRKRPVCRTFWMRRTLGSCPKRRHVSDEVADDIVNKDLCISSKEKQVIDPRYAPRGGACIWTIYRSTCILIYRSTTDVDLYITTDVDLYIRHVHIADVHWVRVSYIGFVHWVRYA